MTALWPQPNISSYYQETRNRADLTRGVAASQTGTSKVRQPSLESNDWRRDFILLLSRLHASPHISICLCSVYFNLSIKNFLIIIIHLFPPTDFEEYHSWIQYFMWPMRMVYFNFKEILLFLHLLLYNTCCFFHTPSYCNYYKVIYMKWSKIQTSPWYLGII